MNGYRPVRVAGDELIHYAHAQATHTVGCEQPITTEAPRTAEQADGAAGDEGPRPCGPCGPCVVQWMAATGRIRLVQRLPTLLIPNTTAQGAVTDHRPGPR